MKCCNNDCNQGRDCPNRTEMNISYIDWNAIAYTIIIIALIAIPFITK